MTSPHRSPKTQTSKKRKRIKRHGQFYVYILECKHNTYYTGFTQDLQKRLELHNNGRGAKYLKGKGPVKLVYAKEYRYFKNAFTAEKDLKKLSRAKKEALALSYA